MPNPFQNFSKRVLSDVGINLLAGAVIAALSWVVNKWAGLLGISPWVSGTLIALLAFTVIGIFGFTLKAKALRVTQAANTQLEMQLADARETTRRVAEGARETTRRVVERLKKNETPLSMKCETSITLDLAKRDHIQELWTLEFPATTPGRLFLVELGNSHPPEGELSWSFESLESGTEVIPVLIVDEPTLKQWALFLDPLVANTPRTIKFVAVWPNLFRELRAGGSDYVVIRGRRGLTAKSVQIHIPTEIGEFEWDHVPEPKISVKRTETPGVLQSLHADVLSPTVGDNYRADFRKRV